MLCRNTVSLSTPIEIAHATGPAPRSALLAAGNGELALRRGQRHDTVDEEFRVHTDEAADVSRMAQAASCRVSVTQQSSAATSEAFRQTGHHRTQRPQRPQRPQTEHELSTTHAPWCALAGAIPGVRDQTVGPHGVGAEETSRPLLKYRSNLGPLIVQPTGVTPLHTGWGISRDH